MNELDAIDQAMLEILERDGRISVKALAARVGLSASPCLRRMRRLEDLGVIRGYSADLDPVAMGRTLVSFIGVVLETHRRGDHAQFEQAVLAEPAILSAHRTTGETDYLLRVATADLDALDRLLWDVLPTFPGIGRFETLVSTSCVKGEFVTD